MTFIIGPSGIGGWKEAATNLEYYNKLGFRAAEVAFTYSVYLDKEKALAIGKIAEKFDISLSIHGQYYINLISGSKEKIKQSKDRILKAVEIGHYLNAYYVCFHSGYYQGMDKEEAYSGVRDEILEMQSIINDNNWTCKLAPETTGKASQFGDIDELLRLVRETKCSLVVDFAHLYARNLGKINYDEIFKKLKGLKVIYAQFTGIEYTNKGERRHIMPTNEFTKDFVKAIIKYKIPIRVICESPDPIKGALIIRDCYNDLNRFKKF